MACKSQGDASIPDFILDSLRNNFKGFAGARNFDPSTAPATLLRHYGLPPKPDPVRQPVLRKAWDRGFSRALNLQAYEFAFSDDLVRKPPYSPHRRKKIALGFSATRFEMSSNWSGAYITANEGRQFMQIWGCWKIPGNLTLPPTLLRGDPSLPYSCSNWIGLDGQRLYFDSSLPQIGTLSTLQADGSTIAQSWIQWWAEGDLDTLPLPLGLAVAPGDCVLCVLTAIDPQTVIGVMVNLSTDTGVAVQGIAPQVPAFQNARPAIAGATAEWIVERPTQPPPTTTPPPLQNFPDYDETRFDLCVAVEASSVDIFSWFTGVPQDLESARIIRMFATVPNPARNLYTSMPTKLGNTSLSVKYGGF